MSEEASYELNNETVCALNNKTVQGGIYAFFMSRKK
jgi:hypothetical protein